MPRPVSAQLLREDLFCPARPESAATNFRIPDRSLRPFNQPALPEHPHEKSLDRPYAGAVSKSIARYRVAIMSGSLNDRKSLSWVGTRAPNDLYFFTGGALMNEVAFAQYQLSPKMASPGILLGYELIFAGSPSVATFYPSETQCVHGVLYKFGEQSLPLLEAKNKGWQVKRTRAQLYSGHVVDCVVFCSSETARPEPSLPTERYLATLVEGALKRGVDPNYVEKLMSNESIPRTPTDALTSFSLPVVPEKITMEALEGHVNARQRDEPGHDDFFVVLNNKVLRWIGPADHPMLSRIQRLPVDKTLEEARNLYDPLYGIPTSLGGMSENQKASIEDAWAIKYKGLFECTGFVAGPNSS